MPNTTRDPPLRKRYYVWGAGLVTVVALLVVALPTNHGPTVTTQTAAALSSSTIEPPGAALSPAPLKVAAEVPKIGPTAEAVKPGETKSQAFTRLMQTGDPKASLVAYKLAAKCSGTRNMRMQLQTSDEWRDPTAAATKAKLLRAYDVDATCGDLSGEQINTRIELLRQAAVAGVHGTWGVFVMGTLTGLPIDVEIDVETENMARIAYEAGLRTGDPTVFQNKGFNLLNDPDRVAEGLMYWQAWRVARALDLGKPLPDEPDDVIKRYSARISAEAAAKAMIDAHTLVASASASASTRGSQ